MIYQMSNVSSRRSGPSAHQRVRAWVESRLGQVTDGVDLSEIVHLAGVEPATGLVVGV